MLTQSPPFYFYFSGKAFRRSKVAYPANKVLKTIHTLNYWEEVLRYYQPEIFSTALASGNFSNVFHT